MLLGASPSGRGGKRAVAAVRSILGNIGVEVFDEDFTLPRAGDAFDDQGRLSDAQTRNTLEQMINSFTQFMR